MEQLQLKTLMFLGDRFYSIQPSNVARLVLLMELNKLMRLGYHYPWNGWHWHGWAIIIILET